jgi:hypothetical protein
VIVVFTDSEMHGGPDPVTAGAIYQPYASITPTPATWTSVRGLLTGTVLLWIDVGSPANAAAQFDATLRDLGQPSSDHTHAAPSGSSADLTMTGAACDAIVARISALAS